MKKLKNLRLCVALALVEANLHINSKQGPLQPHETVPLDQNFHETFFSVSSKVRPFFHFCSSLLKVKFIENIFSIHR